MKVVLLYLSLVLTLCSSLLSPVDYTWNPSPPPITGAFWNNQGGVENWLVGGTRQANFPSTDTDTATFPNNIATEIVNLSANVIVNKITTNGATLLDIPGGFNVTFSGVTPTATGASASAPIFTTNAQVTFDGDFIFDTTSGDWAGGVTGTGGLTLTNNASLILANPIKIVNYAGATLINAGSILQITDVIFQNTALITNNGSLMFAVEQNVGTRTISRAIAGTGEVSVGNSGTTGTVILNGVLTYTGTTNIILGTLNLQSAAGATLGSLVGGGAGQLVINSAGNTFAFAGTAITFSGTTALTAGTLSLRPSQTTNFPSNISGAGNLDLQTTAGTVFTLSGSQTHSGVSAVSGTGSCIFTSMPTATSGITLGAGSSLTLSPTTDSTFDRPLTGPGNLTVNAPSKNLTFPGTVAHSGTTQVTAGNLILNGTITGGTLTVGANGTLSGTGTVTNTVNNRGRVMPGISTSGNLTVGTYTPTGSGTLQMNIAPTSSPQLLPTTANLNGTLLLSLEAGIYPKGTTFTVLTATNPINNDFSSFQAVHAATGVPETSWSKQIVRGNIVRVTVDKEHVVTPTALEALQGNDRAVADYMFRTPGVLTSNADLIFVANQMLALDGASFKSALVRVSPLPYAANPQVGLQNNIQMAVILDKQYKEQIEKSRAQAHSDPSATDGPPLFADPQTGFFIEPIGMYIDQRQFGGSLSNVGQVPFEAFTYGAGLGYEKVLQDKFVIEGGLGYTHSNLNWKQDFGNARWSTVYIAPFFGWFNKVAYGNAMLMGGFNFYHAKRNITFTGFRRTATSSYTSYDILLRINGGARGYLGNDWWVQPDATLNYLTILTPGYSEKGAGSISLAVKSRSNFIMQPSFRAYFIRELFRGDFYYAPKLYVGWLANILLNKDNLEARFVGAPSRIFFTIQGFTKTINQLVLGAELYALKHETFNFTATFEADLLQKLSVYTLKAKYEWMF